MKPNRWLTTVLFALALFWFGGSMCARAVPIEQATTSTAHSVVQIRVRDHKGVVVKTSVGFVVGWNMVATTWSVIDGAHAVTANFDNGRSEVVYGIIGSDKKDDIAIVWVNTGAVKSVRLRTHKVPAVGEKIVVLGGPDSLSSGAAITGAKPLGTARVLETDSPISREPYGRPVLNRRGYVVGMTTPHGSDSSFIGARAIAAVVPRIVTKYLPWETGYWLRLSKWGTIDGRLAMVIVDKTPITRGPTGRLLAICSDGQYLAISSESDTAYQVLMTDGSIGSIAKSKVKLLNYQVTHFPPLPLTRGRHGHRQRHSRPIVG